MSDVVSQGQNAVVIDQRDNVAVATYQLEAGAEARYPIPDGTLASVTVTDDIPLFHKIALVDIPKGEKVVKYGEFIGVATTDIKRGQHVHTHNCVSSDDLKDSVVADTDSVATKTSSSVEGTRTFMGYRRPDGRVGIRNHVLILPTSICASDTTERIANAVEGCVSFHNQNGCSQVDCDQKVTIAALAGYAANPNIYGVVCVSLGCEGCQNDIVVDAIRERTNKPVETLVIQKVGGSIRAIEEGTRLARKMVAEATGASASPPTSPSSSSAPTAAAPTPQAALAPTR